jgi:hypothetical protein
MAQPRTSDDALSSPVLATFVQDLQETPGAQLREVWLFGSHARKATKYLTGTRT